VWGTGQYKSSGLANWLVYDGIKTFPAFHLCRAVLCRAVPFCAQVFVAAHTSAGKTVVAEYAFALAGAHASRYADMTLLLLL
jgi:hypothetical protein